MSWKLGTLNFKPKAKQSIKLQEIEYFPLGLVVSISKEKHSEPSHKELHRKHTYLCLVSIYVEQSSLLLLACPINSLRSVVAPAAL